MNKATIRRWINEYLDGEIGLADKSELEQIMAADPSVRAEYDKLRRISLALGAIPEVKVHPYRFRQNLNAAMDQGAGRYFSPQRVFSVSMLVVAAVMVLSFGLFAYQLNIQRNFTFSTEPGTSSLEAVATVGILVEADVDIERFANRVLLETDLHMIDTSLVNTLVAQSKLFEGAVCGTGSGIDQIILQPGHSDHFTIKASPRLLAQINAIAKELSGSDAKVSITGQGGAVIPVPEFLERQQDSELVVRFKFN